jgi:UDP-glucuronate 4-epimerase
LSTPPFLPDSRPIVITGAAGFIGHHTASLLLDWGFPVIGVDSFTPYYDRDIKEANLATLTGRTGFSFQEEAISTELCAKTFTDVRAVIHLAAQPGVRDSWDDFDNYVDMNIRATKIILDAAIDADVQRLVCASSSSVYGDAPKYPTHETDQLVPRSPYGITKLAAERLAVTYGLARGLSTVSMRYFTVYGPRQRPDMAIQRLITAAYTGDTFPLFGDGRQIRDFTFVGDVARANALAALVDLEPGEVLNVCSEAPTTLADVITTVEQVTGHELKLDRFDVALGDVHRTGGSANHIRKVLGWESTTLLADGIAAQNQAVRAQLGLTP